MNKLLSIHMLFNQCPHLHDTLCMNYHIQDIQIEIHQHNRYNIKIVLGNIISHVNSFLRQTKRSLKKNVAALNAHLP